MFASLEAFLNELHLLKPALRLIVEETARVVNSLTSAVNAIEDRANLKNLLREAVMTPFHRGLSENPETMMDNG